MKQLFPGSLLVAAIALMPQASRSQAPPQRGVVEAVGTETAAPEVAHVLMKVEYESGLAEQAAAGGEKQLREFLQAVAALKIPGLTWRVWNNVLTPRGRPNSGFVYARNIVFSLAKPAGREETIARLEDLGARYNSHCVTCIGSG